VLCAAFLQLLFGFVTFWHKNIGEKSACKMLLTSRANFTNVLLIAFTFEDPKSANRTDDLTVIFVLLGSARVKAERKKLVKLTPSFALLFLTLI